ILAVRAMALRALGDLAGALVTIERALTIGEPEGYLRVFVDEGAPMATLLRRARGRGIAPEYTAKLLEAFGEAGSGHSDLTAPYSTSTVTPRLGVPGQLVEPLTGREREVLRLIASGASNQEIGRVLVVSTATVKKHIHHIFGKLSVKSRTQAVARAKAV